jgi:hypothetical protein
MTKMKLTALELYVLIDTLLHSLQFGKSWSGSATQEARDNVFRKLQQIMDEMEVSVEKEND